MTVPPLSETLYGCVQSGPFPHLPIQNCYLRSHRMYRSCSNMQEAHVFSSALSNEVFSPETLTSAAWLFGSYIWTSPQTRKKYA